METFVELGAPDAGEVLTLQRAAYATEAQAHHDPGLPPLTQTLDEVVAELGDREILALGLRTGAHRLVAAGRARVSAESPVAELARLTVAPDLQGRGIGTRLHAELERRLPATVTEVRLFTGEHSTANLRLYGRLGYTETHRTDTPAGYALIHLARPRRFA